MGISLSIDGCGVRRVLVNPESSGNIMHKRVFNQMKSGSAIKPVANTLVRV